MRRVVALTFPLLLIAAVLGGCVKNLPVGAADWLGAQDGIAAAEILTDNTGAWSSSGLVRGELEPGIDDAAIGILIGKIQKYAAETGNVAFWLGYDDLDFGVTDGDNQATIALWRGVLDVPGVVSGIVFDGDLRVRALRPDAVAALESLMRLPSGVRLEAFADTAALAADSALDIQYERANPVAIEFKRPAGCEPDPAVLQFSEDLLARQDVPGATAELCTGITIDLPPEASMASEALDLRADLDDRGLTEFPVQLTSTDDNEFTHFAAVTPGDPAVLAVLQIFEADGAPELDYSLAPDGTLAITGYEVPTAQLLEMVQGAPAASGLAGIGLEGDPVAIIGTLGQLPGLLDQAMTLDAASDTFGSVQLGQGFGSVHLEAGDVGEDPDVVKAAADLKATGLLDRRFFSVFYLSFQADIVNGQAALTDPDYVGADVLQAFVDAFNAPG